MKLHVRLYSRFREHLPSGTQGEATIQMPDGANIDHLLDHLGIVRRVQLITINGVPETDRTRSLHDGDSVRIFPFVVGG